MANRNSSKIRAMFRVPERDKQLIKGAEEEICAIYGLNGEAEKYDSCFLEHVDYFIESDPSLNCSTPHKHFFGKEIISKDEICSLGISRIFISEIYNTDPIVRELQEQGFELLEPGRSKGYIWAPNWFGDDITPSCYRLKEWVENEGKYDFTPYAAGSWDYRYEVLASNLSDTVGSVMDCGAGSMSLKQILSSEIAYYPIDNTRRSEETIVYDFDSSEEFPDVRTDAAFLCGILEYIIRSDAFIKQLSLHCSSVYLSYNTIDKFPDIQERLYKGWRNHFTVGDLIKLFQRNGFFLRTQIYTDRVESYLIFDRI